MKKNRASKLFSFAVWASLWLALASGRSFADGGFQVFVSNEKSGDLTVFGGGDFKVITADAIQRKRNRPL